MPLSPGQTVTDRYRIEQLIGESGMNVVYEATNTKLHKRVALKVLSESAPPEVAERFQREAIAASRVKHPGIVVIYDADVDDGRPWIAMELLEGESLRERMAKGPVERDDALAIAEEALEALAVVHDAEIVHRDLKPDNLFLERLPSGGRRVKILDFGIAKIASAQLGNATATHSAMGTPHYLAPEQATSAKHAGPPADVYGIGVVLYELLSGQLPYTAATFGELVKQMFTDGPRKLSGVAPHVDAPLAALIDRALSVKPEDRPAGAREMLSLLRSVRASLPSGASAAKSTVPRTLQLDPSEVERVVVESSATVLTPAPVTRDPAREPSEAREPGGPSDDADAADRATVPSPTPLHADEPEPSSIEPAQPRKKKKTKKKPATSEPQVALPRTEVLPVEQARDARAPAEKKTDAPQDRLFGWVVMGTVSLVAAVAILIWVIQLATEDDPPPRAREPVHAAAASVPQEPSAADLRQPPAGAERSASGLAWVVMRPGTGARHPVATDRVEVHYRGWRAEDGELFDSSYRRGQPATFGLNQVIPGWTEAVQLMVEGEKRRVWIPGNLAYDGRPNGPQGMLVFDIELLRIL
ncbi:MAG: protein kinase [Sandaracinaceae bacterium]|nr:protein kinase [Sandaracinaceae bacterium]